MDFDAPRTLTGHEAAVYCLAPWGARSVLSGGGDGWVVRWEPRVSATGKLLARIDDRVFCLLPLSRKREPAGRPDTLVLGTLTGDLYWVSLGRGDGSGVPKRWQFHRDGIFDFVHHGGVVLAAGGDGRLSRWSVATGELLDYVRVDTVRLRSLAYLRSPKLIAVGTAGGDIFLLDPGSLRTVHVIERAHALTPFSLLEASHPADRFFSGGRDGRLRAWSNARPWRQLSHVAAHGATVNQLALSPDGRTLASAGRDREIRLWTDAGTVLAKALIPVRDGGHVASVNACCWLGDGGGLVTGGDDRTLKYWAVKG